jgi:muramoyltetrapeptide carboxypeptidase
MSDRFLVPSPQVIRVVAPAGPVNGEDLARGVDLLRDRGFTVQVAPGVGGRLGYLAGPDEARLEDLQAALDDPEVDAVWFARGGYGTTRLLPRLSAEGMVQRPKVLLGFSDATALFAWACRFPTVRCLYAPSVQELAREGVCHMESLWAALNGEEVAMPGGGSVSAAGPFPVAGGCLTLCSVSVGTSWEPALEGHWLFLEDVGEPLYRIDRMLTHLAQAGWFKRCEGLLLGGFTGLGEGESYGQVVELAKHLVGSHAPLVWGIPVGHLKGKHTLPLGTGARWDGALLIVDGTR